MQNPINTLNQRVKDLLSDLHLTGEQLSNKSEAFKNLAESHSKLIDENLALEEKYNILDKAIGNMCRDCVKLSTIDCQNCPLQT